MHVSARRVVTMPMIAVLLMRMLPISDQRTHDQTCASTDGGAPPGIVTQVTAIVTDHRAGNAAQHRTPDRLARQPSRENRSDRKKRQNDGQGFLHG